MKIFSGSPGQGFGNSIRALDLDTVSERGVSQVALAGHMALEQGMTPVVQGALSTLEKIAEESERFGSYAQQLRDGLEIRVSEWADGNKSQRPFVVTKEQAQKWYRAGMYHLKQGDVKAALNCYGLLRANGAWYQANQLRDAISSAMTL